MKLQASLFSNTFDFELTHFFSIHKFQLSGGLFLAMGLWLHLSNQGYATLYPSHLGLSADSTFILIGGLSIVISFFGCCGSFFESRCCLVIVSHLRVVVLIKQIAQFSFFHLCSTFHSSSFCSWVNSLSALWCLFSAAESRVRSQWISKTELWSTTTPRIVAEWSRLRCQRSGTEFRPISSAVASTRTKIGTTSTTGKTKSGCRSRAAARDTRCRMNLMRDRVTIRLMLIAESKSMKFVEETIFNAFFIENNDQTSGGTKDASLHSNSWWSESYTLSESLR